jgi:cell wall assembly regulator SMI1
MPQIEALLDELENQIERINTTGESWLNEGCDLEDLLELEQTIGNPLPDSYKAIYQRFNGSTEGITFGWLFIPLERTRGYFTGRDALYADSPEYVNPDNPDQVKPYARSPKRIPIVEDYGGSVMYLDLDPAPKGHFGQLVLIFRDYPDTIYSVAPSLDALIKLLIDHFKNGRFKLIDEEYLDFDREGLPSYGFWAELSRQWRSEEPVLSPHAIDSFDKLPELFIQDIIRENDDFVNQRFSVKDAYKIRQLQIREAARDDNWDFLELFSNLTIVDSQIPVEGKLAEKLTSIISLRLSVPIRDLEPISHLRLLRSLELDCQHIQSIALLARLEKLQTIRLHNGHGQSLRPLQQLRNLEQLSLGRNYPSDGVSVWTDWETLTKMPQLVRLEVSNTNFDHLWLLKNLPNLAHIELAGCSFTDYEPLLEAPDELSFMANFDFFERAIEVAPQKGFLFNSIAGESTDEQRVKWERYVGWN